MRVVATAGINVAATVAVHSSECRAVCIPDGIAAGDIDLANPRAACSIRAATAGVIDEAASSRIFANTVDDRTRRKRATGECHLDAGVIPLRLTAEVVEVADLVAADAIVAAWVFMHGAARSLSTTLAASATWNVADRG